MSDVAGGGPPHLVLHVVGGLGIGGMEEHVASLARAGDQARFTHRVCALEGVGPIGEELRAAGVPVECFGLPAAPRRIRPDLLAWLLARMRRHRPRIVYTHSYHPGVYGRLAALLARAPAILAQNHEVADPTHRKRNQVIRLLAGVTDAIFVGSEYAKGSLARCCRIPPGKIHAILPCVAMERFATIPPRQSARAALGLPPGAPAIGYVGRLVPRKGLVYLIEAMAGVTAALPEACLVIAGGGDQEAWLRARADALGLGPAVRFLGVRRDVATVLAGLDVFVLPSAERELFGSSLLEAALVGLPTIGSRLDGIPEALVDGETGLLVEPRDPAALARAILGVLRDPERARAMGRRGRERVLARFTDRHMVAGFEAVYRDVLRRKGYPA
jgi:glycosyltransferase involved in cell wall biosynthesis